MSKRKPHQDFAGYVAELRNPYSGGHTIILDCKRAESDGAALVEDYVLEGGRYQVLCNEHSQILHCPALPDARGCMKDPTVFCTQCRALAGEGDDSEAESALAEAVRVREGIRKDLEFEFGRIRRPAEESGMTKRADLDNQMAVALQELQAAQQALKLAECRMAEIEAAMAANGDV